MELSTFAITIGVLEILIGLPLVLYPKSTMKWLDKMFKEELMMRTLGALMTVLGALVVIQNYEVSVTVEGGIRLVAWLTFFKGITWAWWPETAVRMKKKWGKSQQRMTFGGVMATAIGMLLMYGATLL
ncbi:hypothetical protein H6770_04520 [Candidatus Peribacteria bacterium]|nr:hypothetical protein [Candidatus Peribacteria bacterium]